MTNKKDIFKVLEENTILETKYKYVSKQNDNLRNKITELEEIIARLEKEKEEQTTISEATKDDFRHLIHYLNQKYELNFILEDKLEIVDLSELLK